MKQRYRRCKETEFVDSDFVEALYGDKSENVSSSRHAQRKVQQFCRQVQRALNLALVDSSSDESIAGLFVEDVSPAPDCGHLLVHVLIPTGHPIADAIVALRRETHAPPFGSGNGDHQETRAGTSVCSSLCGRRR